MKKIIVFFGGKSQEHDISVITGVFTLNALDKKKFDGVPVYVDKDGKWWTGKCLYDVKNFRDGTLKGLKRVTLLSGDDTLYAVGAKIKPLCTAAGAINCMHGRNGEDGTVSGVCRLCNIPLASPDVFASALAMDKDVCKTCLKGLGVKTVEGTTVERRNYYDDRASFLKSSEYLGYPVIVKPCSSGSSIGITIAKDKLELMNSLDVAFKFDVKALVEKFIDGAYDVNCACYKIGKKICVSECEKPVGGKFLSFSDKYLGSKTGAERQFPADIDEKISDEIKTTTALIYDKFCFSGIVRTDYLVSGKDVYLNEINAVPGSLAYYLFCDKISAFTDLLTDLLYESFERSREYQGCAFTFSSSVLQFDGVRLKK